MGCAPSYTTATCLHADLNSALLRVCVSGGHLVAILKKSASSRHSPTVLRSRMTRMERRETQRVRACALVRCNRVRTAGEGLCKQGVTGSIPVRSIPSEVAVRSSPRVLPGSSLLPILAVGSGSTPPQASIRDLLRRASPSPAATTIRCVLQVTEQRCTRGYG
jgi:hypothetical protein